VKDYPALDLHASDVDLLYAALDDFGPTAIEETGNGVRAYFLTAADRDAALFSLSDHFPASPLEVSDDDWARRSQENLSPVTVGRITIVPDKPSSAALQTADFVFLVIVPSMGFGTGHHATTRLCLEALQTIDLRNKRVVDVGTGSGVLALAARALGAACASGVDFDPDAIQSARENLALNPGLSAVTFEVADLNSAALGLAQPADVVTANLTGALLVRAAPTLIAATTEGGILILSGLMATERDEVIAAFRPGTVIWERTEDEWVGLAVKKA